MPISRPRSTVIVRRSAFTLIEILVVVLILGIISAIVVPAMGARTDLKAASAARVVIADLLYAQNRAIATSSYVYVQFDTLNSKYTILSGLPINAANTVTHPVYNAPYVTSFGPGGSVTVPGCSLSSASFDTNPILAFDPLGTPYSVPNAAPYTPALLSAGSVGITCGPTVLTILVDPITGQVRMQ